MLNLTEMYLGRQYHYFKNKVELYYQHLINARRKAYYSSLPRPTFLGEDFCIKCLKQRLRTLPGWSFQHAILTLLLLVAGSAVQSDLHWRRNHLRLQQHTNTQTLVRRECTINNRCKVWWTNTDCPSSSHHHMQRTHMDFLSTRILSYTSTQPHFPNRNPNNGFTPGPKRLRAAHPPLAQCNRLPLPPILRSTYTNEFILQ